MSVNNHRKCAKCGRTRAEDMTVTYHRFPYPGSSNVTKARAWAKYCWPNEDWTSMEFLQSLHTTNKVLCGRHFNSTQFYDNNRQKLSKFAVPDSTAVEELLDDRENVFKEAVPSVSIRLKHDSSKTDLQEHRAKVMGKGLPQKKPLPGVKSIILVASGKGGVGKTTTAVNLACAMKVIEPDKEIGLLDADVFGPSVPLMMNISGEPMLNDDHLIEPLLNYGVKCMSMGLLVSGENAVVWRGLMVMQALERLTRHVAWGPLDCLVVDTPPGTGDTHLSLAQNLPIDGALVVTTPQSAALQVTKRGVNMLEKLKVPIIGLVENMSHAICYKCGTKNFIFGNETKKTAQEMGLEIIENFEVDSNMSECINSGKPAIYALPDSIHAEKYRHLANKVFKYIADKDNEQAKATKQ